MPFIIIAIYAAIVGLCFGSFANVLIYRLPKGESIVSPPSHCPLCGKRLAIWDLVPVLSWFFLRGRCRSCNAKITSRYPIVETACAVLFTCMAFYTRVHISLVPLCLLVFVLLCVFCIDMDTQEIPDELLIFGGVVATIWVMASHFAPLGAPTWQNALLGALCGAGPLFLIDRITLLLIKKNGFGFGDVKLMAVAGLYLGWKLSFVALFFAVVIGGFFGVFLMLTKRTDRGEYMAFGPFLSIGIVISLWFGSSFISFL